MTALVLLVLAAAAVTPWCVRRSVRSLAADAASREPQNPGSRWRHAAGGGTSDGDRDLGEAGRDTGLVGGDRAVRGDEPGRGSQGIRTARAVGATHAGAPRRVPGAGRAGGNRRPPRTCRTAATADPALLLDLVAVALAAGAPVPTALAAVGSAWPGPVGQVVARAARALELGAPWDVAWAGASGAARALAGALAPAWLTGASPVPLLRAAAERSRATRRAAARAAAGRLGVQLVLPLGLCFLPAFMLLGLVPVVVSLASGLFG